LSESLLCLQSSNLAISKGTPIPVKPSKKRPIRYETTNADPRSDKNAKYPQTQNERGNREYPHHTIEKPFALE
jgi:hypothetical protein